MVSNEKNMQIGKWLNNTSTVITLDENKREWHNDWDEENESLRANTEIGKHERKIEVAGGENRQGMWFMWNTAWWKELNENGGHPYWLVSFHSFWNIAHVFC